MSEKEQNVREAQGQQRQDPPPLGEDERELEQYGVWVKAGPEDYDEPQKAEDDFSLSDLDDSAGVESLDDTITEEEEELLSSLEENVDLPEAEEFDIEDFDNDEFDETELAELGLDSEEAAAGANLSSATDEVEEELPDIPDEDLPDLELTDESDLSLDLEDESLLSLDEPTGEPVGAMDLPPQTEEFLAAEEPAGSETDFDLSEFETESAASLDEPLPELDIEDTGTREEPVLDSFGDFDDVSAVEQEMSLPSEDEFSIETAGKSAGASDDSLSILRNIEDELQSIKDELSQLKAELSSLRSRPGANAEPAAEERGGEPSGFFAEEEDETIALTGDELDNILNTAEFTEEAGKPTEIEDDIEGFPHIAEEKAQPEEPESVEDELILDEADLLSDTSLEDTLYESSEVPENELPIEEITLEEEAGGEELEEELLEDFDAELEVEEPETAAELPEDLELEFASDEGVPRAGESIDELDLTEDLEPLEEIPEAEVESAVDELTLEEDLTLEEELPVEDTESQPSPDEHEAEALAQMDIESELAEIDELEDETEDEFNLDSDDLDIDLSLADEATGEEEPLELDIEQTEDEFAELAETDMLEEVEEIEELEESDLEEEPIPEIRGEGDEVSLPDMEDVGEPANSHQHAATIPGNGGLSPDLQAEIKTVLRYMDQLLEALPEEKIQEFARSEHFIVYKRLFEELGLEQ